MEEFVQEFKQAARRSRYEGRPFISGRIQEGSEWSN